nr:MAG TPA: hypothetical protein [Caudoviricetes sp.]
MSSCPCIFSFSTNFFAFFLCLNFFCFIFKSASFLWV